MYLAYDDEYLYVAARMWDSEPDRIIALEMVQNRNLRWDDSLAVYLDPFNNKRTGYRFQVNPNGSRDDAVFETPTNMNADWDGIWHAEARIDESGWAAEFAIPFKTLNFDPDNPEWGFSIERSIARKQEEIAWVSYNRQVNPGTTGVISGLTGLQQGRGLDIAPAIVSTQSSTEGVDSDQDAWGWSIASPNSEGFAGWLAYDVFERNFNPALGFVNRENVRRGLLAAGYYIRLDHPMLRELSHFFLANDFHKLSGGLESRSLYLRPLGVTTHAGDEFAMELTRDREVLLEEFEISGGVVIPPGDYEFDAYGFEVTGASIRAIAPRLEAEAGNFFGGDIVTVSTGVGWRPNRHLFLQLTNEYNDVRLPYGDFTARLIRVNADYAFNARWSWLNLVQYDNDSNSAGINSRLRWNPRAGKDLYIVLNHGFDARRGFSGLRSTQSQLAVKYTQTFRL